MANTDIANAEQRKKGTKLPILLGLALCIAGAGAGFVAVRAGMIPSLSAGNENAMVAESQPDAGQRHATGGQLVFVPIDPLVISISGGNGRHLRFASQLEVEADRAAEVRHLMPRVVDVLNSYLRAVAVEDLEDPAALVRLRAQMLRRVQVVLGGVHVSDLLIMEFVLT